MMLSRSQLLEIKDSLRFTWEIFFSRFGEFTPIQQEAIPVVLAGRDCLLSSRTASGKTEAATAPLVERLKREKWEGLSIVYISPTRALVNDLFRRLQPRLEEIGVTARPRTADSPSINVSAPPAVLVTTPESFDALMSRTPRMFLHVRAIVLDEIHLLDSQVRGDQVRVLLHRLRALREDAAQRGDAKSPTVQTVALSATVNDPVGVASRYCINPVIIKVEGKRSIDAELLCLRSADDFTRVIAGFSKRGIRKALVFCASRAECEEWAVSMRRQAKSGSQMPLNPFGDNVFVHHGSLDRKVRLDVEERFSQGPVGICFATSTLELGIDIGDIDVVVLVGPPYSIGSFLQRIGRGNRRTNKTTLLGFYRSSLEGHLFRLMLKAAEEGEQDEVAYNFRPSVIIQQILSYIKQRPDSMFRQANLRMLVTDPNSGAAFLDKIGERTLIDHLLAEELLKRAVPSSELTAGYRASLIYENHLEHSNIESNGGGAIVFDDLTGRVIGEVQDSTIRQKDSFALGANTLDVVRIENGRISVSINNQKKPSRRLQFSSGARALPFHLARKLAERAGIDKGDVPAFEYNGHWHLVHALGGIYGRILAYLLSQEFGWKSKAFDIVLTSRECPPELVIHAEFEQVRDLLNRKLKIIETNLQMGRFQKYLPTSLRAVSVESHFDPNRFCEAINGRTIKIVTDKSRISKLYEIIW